MAATGEHDDQLFQRSQSGEEAAFVSLYRRWQGAIYRYSLRLTGSVPIAEDVTQEVFLALMDRASGFDPMRGSFSAYLYGIARNHVLRRMARESIFAPIFDAAAEQQQNRHEIRNFQDDPLKVLTQQDLSSILKLASADGRQAPGYIEAALVSAYRLRQASAARNVIPLPAKQLWSSHYRGIAATLLVGLLGFAAVLMLRIQQPETNQAPRPASPQAPRSIEIATDFFALTSGAELDGMESGQLVRVRLPRNAMSSYGLPVNHDRLDEPVTAQVLISQDGVARAIRFLSEQNAPSIQTGMRAKR